MKRYIAMKWWKKRMAMVTIMILEPIDNQNLKIALYDQNMHGGNNSEQMA